MPRAAKSQTDFDHLRERQKEVTEKMFSSSLVTAYMKDGSEIPGRVARINSRNNAAIAIRSGNWEVYSEVEICDENGNVRTVDLMDVNSFS